MRHLVRGPDYFGTRVVLAAALFGLIASLASCGKAANNPPQATTQKTFASPEDAGEALFQAAKSDNQTALLSIFGPDAKGVLSSGDAVKDKDTLQGFVDSYTQMHRWREIKSGGEMLYIGSDNWIFPIPLGRNPAGQWYFDTAAGKDEMLARRIGRDELTAIAACAAIADAQNKYFRQSHDGTKQYALKLISDQGKQNGLYWPVSSGQAPSPLEDVRDFAKAAGYSNSGDNPQPFDGYFFRILTKQGDTAKGGAKDYVVNGKMTGGFAVLAYPAEYRNSGIMTFIVSTDGVVYQKDLGEKSTEVARALTEYDPADGWKPAL
ncbi:MAG TPA: DUF2950 family protein [Candidatus Sulfotelmatobacter sp.]|nr:DUF2950 family protein [Candidatus Sulfotelmatobacter sp.]